MDWTLLEVARVMALRSTCSRAAVGAVIAVDGRVCATGFNGAPRGLPHCLHPPGERSADGSVAAIGCETSVHAEANAIVFAARHGVPILGATLYTTLTPCVPCALLVLNAGIVRVVSAVRYRDETGMHLLADAGIAVQIRESDRRSIIVHDAGQREDSLRRQRGDGV